MKKYLWVSSTAVVIGALRINTALSTFQIRHHMAYEVSISNNVDPDQSEHGRPWSTTS